MPNLKNKFIKYLLGAWLIFLLNFLVSGHALYAADDLNNPFDETIRILERWTSAHWGRDCFVWIVHYPDEIAEPWAASEALKVGMSESEGEAYRKKFIADLKLDDSETFLLSIYSFGSRPVNIAPIADNIALVTQSGERVKPTRYDSSLDYASSGIVQGLIFFPKQNDKNYAVALKGMGVHDERVFSFGTPQYVPPLNNLNVALADKEPEVVIVDIPKSNTQSNIKNNNKTAQSSKNVNSKKVTVTSSKTRRTVDPAPENEITQLPPPVPREIPPLFAENSKDMAEFVKSAREPNTKAPDVQENKSSKNNDRPETKIINIQNTAARTGNSNSENSYVSREYVLKNFLALWAANKPAEMYEMLSDASKKLITRENFTKEISKSSDFRAALKGDYKIDWVGEERAKIIGDRKVLMFKSLVTRTLGITRENSSWKVVW